MDASPGAPASWPLTLSFASLVVGIASLIITILNLFALYAPFISTLRSAPIEVRDALGALRAQLTEEREALRQQALELRSRRAQAREARQRSLHPAHAGRARSSSRTGLSPRPSSSNLRAAGQQRMFAPGYSEQTLGAHYQAVRDMWRQFTTLERPFLVPRGPGAEGAGIQGCEGPWGHRDLFVIDEKTAREDFGVYGEGLESRGGWPALYRCGFVQRFIWWQIKPDIAKLSDEVQRIMMRRMEREVTCTRMMLKQLRDGGDGPEEIASPQFDSAAGALAASGWLSGSRGPVSLGIQSWRWPPAESYNIYESSESSSSATGPKPQRRPDKRDSRATGGPGARQACSPPDGSTRGRAAPELHYTGEGWRQGQLTRVAPLSPRGQAPPVLEDPQASRPRTRSQCLEGPPPGSPSPHAVDRRR